MTLLLIYLSIVTVLPIYIFTAYIDRYIYLKVSHLTMLQLSNATQHATTTPVCFLSLCHAYFCVK